MPDLVKYLDCDWSFLSTGEPTGILCLTAKGIHPPPLGVALSQFDKSIFKKNSEEGKKISSNVEDNDNDSKGKKSSNITKGPVNI